MLLKEENIILDYAYTQSGFSRPLGDLGSVNTDKLFALIKKHKLFNMNEDDPFTKLLIANNEEFSTSYDMRKKRMAATIGEMQKLLPVLAKNGLFPFVMKGLALSFYLFDCFDGRVFSDVDFIVPERDMLKMDAVLRRCGFKQYYKDLVTGYRQPLEKPLMRSRWHHEYYAYEKEIGGTKIVIEIAKQLHNSTTAQQTEAFFKTPMVFDFYGNHLQTFDYEHTLLCLIENIYSNDEEFEAPGCQAGGVRLRDYLELYLYFKKYKCTIDFQRFNTIVSDCGLKGEIEHVIADLIQLYSAVDHTIYELIQLMDLKDNISPTVNVFDKLFNNMLADTQYFTNNILKIFSCTNPYYTNAISSENNTWELSVVCPDGPEARINLSCKKQVLDISVSVNEKKYSRISLFLYRKDAPIKSEIIITSGQPHCTVNNTLYKRGECKKTNSLLSVEQHSEESSYHLMLPYECILWKDAPNLLGVGFLLEEKMAEKVYWRAYNMGVPPASYCLKA